jgi:hypothetical protein
MAHKKTVLVLLLVVSLLLMLTIVFFIKTRYGYFGYSYHQFIEDMALKYDAAVETNMGKINSDIQYLSSDDLVRSVFESSSRGEPTDKYYPDFDKIKNAIEDCQKLQILDFEGKIIFSLDTNEINKIKVVRKIMTVVDDHFLTNDFVYIYLLNKDLMASFYPVPKENTGATNGGFVVLYYNMKKLFSGIPSGQIVADGAISNLLITSKTILNKNKVNYLMDYLKNPQMYKKIEKNEKSVYVVRKNIHGIELLYYPSNERFIPILGGIALTACLFLFFLVVTALVLILREEKIIQDIPVKPVNVNLNRDLNESDKTNNLKTLIRDIEESNPYNEKEAKQGIEGMIMTNGIHLTEAIPEISSEYQESMDKQEGISSEEKEGPSVESKPVETYDFIKPSKATDLFAEEDLILKNIEANAPAAEKRVSSLKERTDEDEFELKESFVNNEFPDFKSGLKEEKIGEEPEFESVKFDMGEFKETGHETVKQASMEENLEIPVEEMPPLADLDKKIEMVSMDAGEAAMAEPPQKVSSICSVEDYVEVIQDLIKKSLNINKIMVLKRENDEFSTIINKGYIKGNLIIQAEDPLLKLFQSMKKGIDINGNLSASSYLKDRFDTGDLEKVDEIFIVPIVKRDDIVGIAFYSKDKNISNLSHYQKLELLNLSFLQES